MGKHLFRMSFPHIFAQKLQCYQKKWLMKRIHDFTELTTRLVAGAKHKRVAVVCPRDASTCEALAQAAAEGFIEVLAVDDVNPQEAARKAVAMVRAGEADILMKGLINSDIFLRAILHREQGLLLPGQTLTHIGVAYVPMLERLLFYSDASVIPYPTQEQRWQQLAYLVAFCQRFGIESPRVSLLHCSEKVDGRHFPFTEGYAPLIAEAKAGAFGACVVDGPLDLTTSLSLESMQTKGINSPIAGAADALLFPDIESGNLFHKAVNFFAKAETAAVLMGTTVPVILTSRSDNSRSKYVSLAVAAQSLISQSLAS